MQNPLQIYSNFHLSNLCDRNVFYYVLCFTEQSMQYAIKKVMICVCGQEWMFDSLFSPFLSFSLGRKLSKILQHFENGNVNFFFK